MKDTIIYSTVYRHRKNKAGKWVYYAHFYDPETGKRRSAVSTGKTTKRAAMEWCLNQVLNNPNIEDITFCEFTKDWWDYDNCPYIAERSSDGHSYSKAYVDAKRSELIRHLLPEFGDMKLSKISVRHIQSFKIQLKKVVSRYNKLLSPKSINAILGNMRIIMEEAKRLEYIRRNPLDHIKDIKIESAGKQFLAQKDVKTLFTNDALDSIWMGDLKMYTLNLLAATTGLRMGECQALRAIDIDLETRMLSVSRSWARQYGFKSPKTVNSVRNVPFPKKTAEYLKQILDDMSVGDSAALIFSNISDPHIPVDHKTILEKLYLAFTKVGLSEESRKERKITFHSWRHFFVSKVRPHVPEYLIQAVIGHSNKSVTDQYTHQLDLEDYEPIRKAQETLV